MRIGLISGEFPPMQGGVGAFSERLAQAMAGMGHTMHVVTHREARPRQEGGARYSLSELKEPLETDWGLLHPVGRHWRWGDVSRIAEVAIRYDLDVLNIQYQAAAYNMRIPAINLAPWRLKGLATTIVTFHDLRVPYLFPKAGRLRQFVVRLAARKSDGIIVTNSGDRESVAGWALGKTRVAEIPIGSNIIVHEATPQTVRDARREMGLSDEVFLLGYFGFLNPSKGADSLVQALARLDGDVHLVFIGGRTGSSDRQTNEQFVAQVEREMEARGVSERVHSTGFLPDKITSYYLQAADLIVLPYRDGASLRRGTLMAALAHGKPVVTTQPQTSAPKLSHGENIWLVEPDDPEALAAAIDVVSKDSALRAKLADGAKRLSREFSWAGIAARTVSFYEELATGGRRVSAEEP